MSKAKDLHRAVNLLSPQDYIKYKEWRNKTWVERYPYTTVAIIELQFVLILMLLVERTK